MFVPDASLVTELADHTARWCVSAYLPVHEAAGRDTGDTLRLKNLLRAAEHDLLELGMHRAAACRLVADAAEVANDEPGGAAPNPAAIALFAAPDLVRSVRLAGEARELVNVAGRFHLKPLLGELAGQRRFFVLAVTRGSAQLHEGGPAGLRPVAAPGMPASLDDAIQYDDRERAVLSHSASRRGIGGVVAAFHGQGDRADHLPEDMMRYLRMVDGALNGIVGATTPLVLAGSRDTVAAFRSVTSRSSLVAEDVYGNPDTMPPSELNSRAEQIVASADSGMADDAAAFAQFHGTGKASADPATVLVAARRGRVATAFVASDAERWGRFDPDAEAPELHEAREPGDEDLLDTAAQEAWRAGATVHVVPGAAVPGTDGVAALFRY